MRERAARSFHSRLPCAERREEQRGVRSREERGAERREEQRGERSREERGAERREDCGVLS